MRDRRFRKKLKKNSGNIQGSYIAKGKQKHFKYSVYLVGWIDLLGYGSMLRECEFDPSAESAKSAINRLELFHSTLHEEADRLMPIMQINDGAVLWRELSLRTPSVTFDFLKRAIHLFEKVNAVDLDAGYYGARMVLATGIHMKMGRAGAREENDKNVKWLIHEVEAGKKDFQTAIYEAASFTSFFNNTPSLQANFAFSKAYIAEGQGTKAGFEGNHLFIDTAIFSDTIPEWLKFDKTVHWEYPGLTTDFIQYSSIDVETANKTSGRGVLQTDEIAKKLTKERRGKKKLISRLK